MRHNFLFVRPVIRCAARQQKTRGVVLVITLILLVVVGISSAVAIRSALVGDQVTNNLRTQSLALQAAEMALRFCEADAVSDSPTIAKLPPSAVESDTAAGWRDLDNWDGASAAAVAVPTEMLTSSETPIAYGRAPQCLIETLEFNSAKGAPEESAFLVTARGFSPDYQRDALGNSAAGSEVWLQSTIRTY